MVQAVTTPPSRPAPTLRGRVSLVLTAIIAILLMIATIGWMRGTRDAIHEEVSAAARVAEQWLNVLIPETFADGADADQRLMSHLQAVGRLRANRLELIAADGRLLYVSPESSYKAGRFAPAWFAAQITPTLETRHFTAGDLAIRMVPDSSRAVLDAWDHLVAGAGWGASFLVFMWLTTRAALNRALAPIGQINAALARGADGHFDTRLPGFAVAELDHLAESYNRLADSLDQSMARNARLEEDQAFAHAMQRRLEAERRLIARELHDELGQGITAVRAIAGAIQQRTADQPNLHGSAQAILAMTGQMQDGVRTILQRLRPVEPAEGLNIDDAVANYCVLWSSHHPDIDLRFQIESLNASLPESVQLTVMRLLQESLTNVARHAGAHHVEVSLVGEDDKIVLRVSDDGVGLDDNPLPDRFGLLGMRERVAELKGELSFDRPASGGLCICARLPRSLSRKEKV